MIPVEYQAEGVLAALGGQTVQGSRVLIPRAEVARETLPEELRARGARVDVVPVYRTIVPKLDVNSWRQQLVNRDIDAVTFTSSSTVRNCIDLLGGAEAAKDLLKPVAIACIGPITAGTVEEYGLTVAILSRENTVPALVEAIAQYYGSREQITVGTRP
jgi:uroporphyrinogen III methyltransferase/synthase